MSTKRLIIATGSKDNQKYLIDKDFVRSYTVSQGKYGYYIKINIAQTEGYIIDNFNSLENAIKYAERVFVNGEL